MVTELGLNDALVSKLNKAGFSTVSQIVKHRGRNVAQLAGLTIDEYRMLGESLESLKEYELPFLTPDSLPKPHYCTVNCRPMDQAMGGGFVSGLITEIAGVPGSGKTTLVLQTAIASVVDQGKRAILIDTEGGLSALMGTAKFITMVQRVLRYYSALRGEKIMPDSVINKLTLIRAFNIAELVGCIAKLKLDERKGELGEVGLVAVDSIAFHFKYGLKGANRTDLINSVGLQLLELATKLQCSVIAVNHLQVAKSLDGAFRPYMGDAWAPFCAQKVMVDLPAKDPLSLAATGSFLDFASFQFKDTFAFLVYESPLVERTSVPFVINEFGVVATGTVDADEMSQIIM
ncbi:hypothetical protein PCE1_001404 [Barthelona sp. PCE]